MSSKFLDEHISEIKILQIFLGIAFSPTKTGNKIIDQYNFYNIANEILEFSKKGLKSNGKIVIKVFIGLGFDAFNKKSKEMFKKTTYFKPKSSRPESVETYLIASTIRL